MSYAMVFCPICGLPESSPVAEAKLCNGHNLGIWAWYYDKIGDPTKRIIRNSKGEPCGWQNL